MAQVWNADARSTNQAIAFVDGVPQDILATVPITLPQQTSKFKVLATLEFEPMPLATSVQLLVTRNKGSDNVFLGTWVQTFPAATGVVNLVAAFTDEIASPRDVAYTMTVTVVGDAATLDLAYIEAMQLSG